MAERSVYACRNCDYRSGKWLGRCPGCEAWDTLERWEAARAGAGAATRTGPRPVRYPDLPRTGLRRLPSGIGELDRVLGGGLVPGGVVLLGGEPGVGKSTLLLQAASRLAGAGERVLYVSGEESPVQLRMRGDRLGVGSDELFVVSETEVDEIVDRAAEVAPRLLIVDSIQALRCSAVSSVPGSVAQVRESAARLVQYAKTSDVPVLLIGHVTKDGSVAGPRALEHVVDTVIQFEGERHHAHRILRTLKNRFGASDELGVFEMGGSGLKEVANPSRLFLAQRAQGVPGSAVLAAIEGSRPLLVEIQALVGPPIQGSPRRTALGVDGARVAMILAVLQRRAGLELAQRDVFVNVTGGLTVLEPGADLAVAAAVASSAGGRPLPEGCVVLGEIGLTGEIRGVARSAARLREAARLGFSRAVVPGDTGSSGTDLEVLEAADLARALDLLTIGPPRAGQIG